MASQIATELEDTVRRVPMIGWVALAGGAALFVFARHNSTAANILNPNAATPNVDSGALPGQVFPPDTGGSVTAGTTPDPGSTAVVPPPDYHQKTTDILGGTLGQFIAGLTNQPDFVNYTSGDQSITESSGVATFGGGGGTALRAPDWLRAQGDYLQAADTGQAGIISAQGQAAFMSQQGQSLLQTAWGNAQAAILKAMGSAVQVLNPGQGYYDPNANRVLAPAPPVNTTNLVFAPPPSAPAPAAPEPVLSPFPNPSHYWGGTSCNSGNYSCIKYACHSGDTGCAHSVAPWWRGDTISGW